MQLKFYFYQKFLRMKFIFALLAVIRCDVWDDLENAEINGMPEEEQSRLSSGLKSKTKILFIIKLKSMYII